MVFDSWFCFLLFVVFNKQVAQLQVEDRIWRYTEEDIHIQKISCFSLSSPFSSVSSTNCPLQQKASNQKASAGLCPRDKQTKKQTMPVVHTDYWEHGYVLRFVSSPSFPFLPFATLFIPHWLTCFTSTAVISTAFTELINGAEGRALLNWDNSFSLSLAHTDNYIEKKEDAV